MSAGALVLGGAGFIGSHLLADLAARGVRPLICLDIAKPERPVDGVDYRHGDVRAPFDELVPEAVSVVYNLAAVHRTPGHPDHAYYDTNVAGALNACGYAARRGVQRLVFTSSIAVYGPREEPCTESTPLRPVSAYGRSKALAEAIHEQWADVDPESRRLAVLRSGVVFGRGENGNFDRLLRQMRRGAFVFPGRRDTIKGCGYVGELVRAIGFAVARDDRVYHANFAYPEPHTIEAIARTLSKAAGLRAPRWTVPTGAVMAAAWGFEVLARFGLRTGVDRDRVRKLLISTDVRPDRLTADGYRFETDLASGIRSWLASLDDG
ncbi:NAD(P)-dependent oxidoreductase [Thalassobaculum sp.]|uniref:NAD-dependent epimerase/dehydratase family protein n=1 Tax=Thalassobaculum sp. TaxID=2022740 RepID=UPI0032EEF394